MGSSVIVSTGQEYMLRMARYTNQIVCLRFFVHSRIFHSYGYDTMTSKGLQILTYTQQLWPLSNEGSLTCHNYFDTGHPLIMVFSEAIAKRLEVELSLPAFTNKV